MRVTAKITAEEERYDTFKCVATSKIITGYEMESVQHTLNIQPNHQNARSNVRDCGRKLGLAIARFLSLQMPTEQVPGITAGEKDAGKLDFVSEGGSEKRRKEKEELWKKVMLQTTRIIPKEENYVVIEELSLKNKSGPLDSQNQLI